MLYISICTYLQCNNKNGPLVKKKTIKMDSAGIFGANFATPGVLDSLCVLHKMSFVFHAL